MFVVDVNGVLSLAQAASLGLLHFPILNASVDEGCQKITYKVSACSEPASDPRSCSVMMLMLKPVFVVI